MTWLGLYDRTLNLCSVSLSAASPQGGPLAEDHPILDSTCQEVHEPHPSLFRVSTGKTFGAVQLQKGFKNIELNSPSSAKLPSPSFTALLNYKRVQLSGSLEHRGQ